jgi:Asp-tRNA(Asn)/Glu-tRNA(Gln) amidotransferase A subunit family amidase
MATPIWQWSAVDTAAAIRDGRATSEEVVQSHIDRMHTANPAINAIVVDLSAQAIEAARAADRALAQGATPGKLQGVPVTIKINIDVEGQTNSNGVVAFKDNIAPGDSPVTANLKKAGAIIIGMTNTPEFSMRGFTDNPLHGPTLNPWDSTITCGGSSGGAGASIASGIGAIAHGNDIGGSLRWPAYCNGIATIKPTQGRIPAFNPSAPVERPLIAQFMSAQGPLAREVRDVRLGLEVMSQRDMRDPWWVPAPLEGPSPAKPIKVALARIPDNMETDAAVLALLRTPLIAEVRQVLEFAAERLGCTAAELVLDNWTVRRGNYVHPLEPMIAEHYGGAGFEFIGCGMVKVPNDPEAPLNAASLFWMPSWVGAEVEVDRETGKVQVVHLVVGADSGRSVNAVACRGQVEGAALQAFGQSLFEELRYVRAHTTTLGAFADRPIRPRVGARRVCPP